MPNPPFRWCFGMHPDPPSLLWYCWYPCLWPLAPFRLFTFLHSPLRPPAVLPSAPPRLAAAAAAAPSGKTACPLTSLLAKSLVQARRGTLPAAASAPRPALPPPALPPSRLPSPVDGCLPRKKQLPGHGRRKGAVLIGTAAACNRGCQLGLASHAFTWSGKCLIHEMACDAATDRRRGSLQGQPAASSQRRHAVACGWGSVARFRACGVQCAAPGPSRWAAWLAGAASASRDRPTEDHQ